VLEGQLARLSEKKERHCTTVDLIKQRKLTPFGHICWMKYKRMLKTVMLGMVEGDS